MADGNGVGERSAAGEVTVLYEDEQVLVVNKPAGLLVHPDGRSGARTLVDWIRETHPGVEGVGEPLRLATGAVIDRPGIVHRLDAETSGALAIAKTQEAFLHLKRQFAHREVRKEYSAFVWGRFKEKEGVIDRPIGRSAKDFRLRSAQRGARGVLRAARTRYSVLVSAGEWSFLCVTPETGRTHQIRVHMKAINHPVVCDRLYAPRRACALGFARLALHARALAFSLPSGEALSVAAPPPDDFREAYARLVALAETE